MVARRCACDEEPDYMSVRSSCMAVVANLVLHDTASRLPSLHLSLGLAVRSAMAMAMHRDSNHFEGMPASEAAMRNRLWTTIVYLDILMSARTGLPPAIRTDSYDAKPTEAYGNNSTVPNIDSGFLSILTQIMSTAGFIIETRNSVSPEIEYTKVEDCDKTLRDLLVKSRSLPSSLQTSMLEMLLRRVLLSLHTPHSRHGKGLQHYPRSHWAVLECSLGLLSCHQRLAGDGSMLWLLNLFREDIQLALIYVVLGIRRNDFSTEPDSTCQLQYTPKQIAWTAIRQSVEIFGAQAHRSWTSYRVHLTSLWLLTALETVEIGKPSTMLQRMVEATEGTIREIETKMGVITMSNRN